MSNREPKYSKKKGAEPDEYWLRKGLFEGFGPSLLGLTNVSKGKQSFEGLAVILDLKDFTVFCDRRNSHLVIPRFLDQFLTWLFERISEELLKSDEGEEVILWSHLPIFGKFLGDGVLLIWDVTDVGREARRNIVFSFDIICIDYQNEFFKSIKRTFAKAPSKLRCGIAQGKVTSIAEGNDYVGMCINVASRLQKLRDAKFSFGFTKKGLEEISGEKWYRHFRLIEIPIKGVAKPQLVYVLKEEFRALSKTEQHELHVRPRRRV